MALKQMRNRFNKNNLTVLYKLLNDLLFIEIVFFLVAIVGESLLPGTETSHVVFLSASFLAGATVLAIAYTGNKSDIKLSGSQPNKKIAVLLLFILIVFLFSSLIKINIILNIVISLTAISIGYFIYRIILKDHNL